MAEQTVWNDERIQKNLEFLNNYGAKGLPAPPPTKEQIRANLIKLNERYQQMQQSNTLKELFEAAGIEIPEVIDEGTERRALEALRNKVDEAKILRQNLKKVWGMAHGVVEIARAIGEFYLEKNNQDYEKTRQDLIDLRIHEIRVVDSSKEGREIEIITARPGVLIGKRGENIDKLATYLKARIKIKEALYDLLDWMVPVPEQEHYDEIPS